MTHTVRHTSIEDIPLDGADAVKRILYIDAYDSFSRNIIDLLERTLNVIVTTIRIDEKLSVDLPILASRFDAIVAGPGPGSPTDASDIGHMKDLWKLENIPILGICLGFQSLCCEYGAEIAELPSPRHGRVVGFEHAGTDIFRGLSPFRVTLYHSLGVKLGHPIEEFGAKIRSHAEIGNCPSSWYPSEKCDCLFPLAWYKEEGTIDPPTVMAVRHRTKPFWGVQFHPESCKSDDDSKELIMNWWNDAQQRNRDYHRDINRQKLETPEVADFFPGAQGPEVDDMIKRTVSAGKKVNYRVCDLGQLDATRVSEIVGVPYNPSVVLEVDSRYSIISVLSAGAWALECSLGEGTVRSWSPGGNHERVVKGGMEFVHGCIRRVLNAKRAEGGDPEIPFWGGFLGHFSYEMGTQLFNIEPSTYIDGEKASDTCLLWVERSIVMDRQRDKIYVQSLRKSDNGPDEWLELMTRRLAGLTSTERYRNPRDQAATPRDEGIIADNALRMHYSEEELVDDMMRGSRITPPDEFLYKKQIDVCQEYIRRGDSYELCLTGETKVELPACDDEKERRQRRWLLYKRLQRYNPASYSGYAQIGDAKIMSSSPELFMRWDRQATFEMKPMKGTVKKTPDMTLKRATEILGSAKEMGENLMIADLIRHDLSHLCGSGNVDVVRAMEVEEHTLVYQLITHIKGYSRLLAPILQAHGVEKPNRQSGHDHYALGMCMPVGSMTGAPKKRSCDILDRIEKRKRGIYSGVMGFLDVGGGGSFSVIIRSAFSLSSAQTGGETWRIGAGGAITALSTAQGEWDEMVTKLNTVLAVFLPSKHSESDCSGDTDSAKNVSEDGNLSDTAGSEGSNDRFVKVQGRNVIRGRS